MKTFREIAINEKKIIMSNVQDFVTKTLGITNMDFEKEGNIISFNAWMSKTGKSFDNFVDDMKEEYGRKFSFIDWDKDIAKFEIKI